ncbi:hypothetical protein ACJ41O_000364 [Fusarium nematophilum]
MVVATTRPDYADGKPYQLAYNPADRPIIPDPSIFNFDGPDNNQRAGNSSDVPLPRIAECAAHLELLETLYVLRQHILVSEDFDTAAGIRPIREIKTGYHGDTKTLKDPTFWERRQAKWTKFVEFAVVRFLAWQEEINKNDDMSITEDNLPPLDVIMVWHSFLLNPLLFRHHCLEQKLFSLELPWRHIHASVDNEDWTFKLGPNAETRYEDTFGVSSDLFKQFEIWGASSNALFPKILELAKLALEIPSAQETTFDAASIKYSQLFNTFRSDLATQLRDAVIRQTSFIDKMNAHMWIRSPALEGTIRRGIDRYLKFCKLFRHSESHTMVPTLDIDLVWHTHQCTARYYGRGMRELAGRFVNHDDTIAKGKLGDGFEETRRLFRMHFGQEYRVCGCWDCQALLTELEGVDGGEELDVQGIAERVKEQVCYYRAVEWARRRKGPLPMRAKWDETQRALQ